jgi:C-22 sterol desaturase
MFNDLNHQVTPLSEEIKVFATIFPKDDLILSFTERDPFSETIVSDDMPNLVVTK